MRFQGFEGEWEEKKLGDIAEKINSGKTPLGGEAVYTDEGVLFIRSQNVNNDKLDLSNSAYIPEAVNEGMKNSVVLPNDILLNITGASLGRSCIVPRDFTVGNVNQHVCIIRLGKEYNPRFIQPILSSVKGQNMLTSLQTGSGREGLNFESIRRIKVYTPKNRVEQDKIAGCLAIIQDRIDTQNKIIKQYQSLIQNLREKLIFQKLRFRDKNGNDFSDWHSKKIGEVALKKTSNISANKIDEKFGEFVVYGASGVLKLVDFYEEENDYIGIVKDGAGVGRLMYCRAKSSVLGTIDIIKPKEALNTYFLYCILSRIDFSKYVTGSTIPHIYFKDYSNELFGIPGIEEQLKIANFLSFIDNKVSIEINLLQQLENQKKYLLQNMFI